MSIFERMSDVNFIALDKDGNAEDKNQQTELEEHRAFGRRMDNNATFRIISNITTKRHETTKELLEKEKSLITKEPKNYSGKYFPIVKPLYNNGEWKNTEYYVRLNDGGGPKTVTRYDKSEMRPFIVYIKNASYNIMADSNDMVYDKITEIMLAKTYEKVSKDEMRKFMFRRALLTDVYLDRAMADMREMDVRQGIPIFSHKKDDDF